MITFGYKNKFTGPLRALTALAIGIVMVVSRTNALELAVRIIAAFIIASGVVSLIVGYKNKANRTFGLLGFNGVLDLVLGVVLFSFPEVAAGLLIWLIAFVLIAFGLFQLLGLLGASRVLGLGFGSFVLPVLVLMAGFFLIARPAFLGEAIGVVAGIALILYGTSELFSSWRMRKYIDQNNVRQGENDVEEQ